MAEAASAFLCGRADAPRLDRFLSEQLPDWSRTALQAQVRAGRVLVNGREQRRPSHLLAPGDRVEAAFAAQPAAPEAAQAEALPLALLYEDDDLAVVNKPAGMAVHAGAGRTAGTLANALLYRYPELAEAGAARPGIVHRLDRLTSGAIVVARNAWTHQRLAQQFQRREVEKIYRALAQGLPREERGEIELGIGRDRLHRVRMSTRRPAAHSRAARTSYRVTERFPAAGGRSGQAGASYAWLEVRIHTGRTHQIRVHLAAIGHPVAGDRLYGAAGAITAGPLAGRTWPRPMLHAETLGFTHPRSQAAIRVTAPLPEDLQAALAALREGRAV
jgi:23S rRNA pseudouridine1911/1915/1917 synthase